MYVYYNNWLTETSEHAEFSSDSSNEKSDVTACWIFADLGNSYTYLFHYLIKGWFIMIIFALQL